MAGAAPRVVIAGAGFAGLNIAKALRDACDATLVAPTDRFVYLPLIHEVLSETVGPDDVTRRLKGVLAGVKLVHARADFVDRHELVLTDGRRLGFDVLVVAVGAEPNDFGVPGVGQHALPFYSVGDALRANAVIKMAVADAHDQGRSLRMTVVGAGATGVEVAGEAEMLVKKLSIDHSILVLDALPEIFPRQTAKFRKEVRAGLDRLGIEVRTGQKITKVARDHLVVEDKDGMHRIDSDVTFWCAGVRPRAIAGVDPKVRRTLQSVARDDVYVVGDAATFPKDLPVPKLAQTAEEQTAVVAHNILHPGRKREYRPHVKGIIVSVGHNYAVAELAGRRVMAGNIPWHVKRALYKAKIALA